MKFLIVDDSYDKIAGIIAVIRSISADFTVDTVVDFVSAQRKLLKNKYDLMLTDLFLPLVENAEKDSNGGRKLVLELYRNPKLISPDYIVGITQYQELLTGFSKIWPVFYYEPSSDIWKECITETIGHIQKAKAIGTNKRTPLATIFCEGNTDKMIVEESIRLFFPDFTGRIEVKSDKGAGASWVARQIIVWAYSLHGKNGNYVKAAGLLDNDLAGNEAIQEINRKIDNTSAQRQTFKVFKLSPTYARHIIPLYQKGINLPVSLEEMLPYQYWQYAATQGWLEKRHEPVSLLKDSKNWNMLEQSLTEHLSTLGLTTNEQVYLNKVRSECKVHLCDYLLEQTEEKKKEALSCFKPLLDDIIGYFGL